MGSNLGIELLIAAMCPILAEMVITGDFSLFIGANLWYTLGLAFGLGLAAAITAIGSGLNTYGTMLTFTLAFTTTLYALFIGVTIDELALIPYGGGAIISGISLFCYCVGVFCIATSQA